MIYLHVSFNPNLKSSYNCFLITRLPKSFSKLFLIFLPCELDRRHHDEKKTSINEKLLRISVREFCSRGLFKTAAMK